MVHRDTFRREDGRIDEKGRVRLALARQHNRVTAARLFQLGEATQLKNGAASFWIGVDSLARTVFNRDDAPHYSSRGVEADASRINRNGATSGCFGSSGIVSYGLLAPIQRAITDITLSRPGSECYRPRSPFQPLSSSNTPEQLLRGEIISIA